MFEKKKVRPYPEGREQMIFWDHWSGHEKAHAHCWAKFAVDSEGKDPTEVGLVSKIRFEVIERLRVRITVVANTLS